jgi:hypothetical protein
MLLLAGGLFRLDVVVSGDTLRTVVRNLSLGPLGMPSTASDYSVPNFVIGEAAVYQPARSTVEFSLGSGSDRVVVKVLMAILHFTERGTVRATAQASIHHARLS